MSLLGFAGHLLLGCGPGLVFYLTFIAPRPFLVLLVLTSSFYWLIVLLVTSSIFRGFYPIDSTASAYSGVLIATVAIQECARYGAWRCHKLCIHALEQVSNSSQLLLTAADRLYLGLAWGFGHGACHVVFFFVSFLHLTLGKGTIYNPLCPQYSVFTNAAVNALAFGMLLPSLTLISFEGFSKQKYLLIAYAPVAHLVAVLTTLGNFTPNGCVGVVPAVLMFGAANMILATAVCWRASGALSARVTSSYEHETVALQS